MRCIRPWYVGSLLLVSACADAPTAEDASELQAFLTDAAAPTPAERQRLNAGFARQAVRAWGYRSAGVQPRDAEAWSPVMNGEEAGDVSAWLDALDITERGVFAPCESRECSRRPLSDVQRAALGPRLSSLNAFQTVERLTGAALRLAGAEADIRWTEGLEVGMVLHGQDGVVEINPRLLELLSDGASSRVGQDLVAPSPEIASRQNDDQGPVPVPPAPEPRASPAPLRNHEPPAGQTSDSSSDCDCGDCDLIDVRCAVQPLASGDQPRRLLSRQLFLALAALTLLARRRSRSSRRAKHARRAGWAMRFLSAVALGLVTCPADAQTPDSGSRLAAAKTHEEAGRYPEAYVALGELLRDEALLKKPDRERLRRQRDALEAKLAFVYVEVEPATASVLVDGHEAIVDPSSKLVVVNPGPHHIAARAEGFLDAGQSVATQAGRKAVVRLSLSPSPTVAPVQSPLPAAAVTPPKEPAAAPQRVYKFRQGPYVVAHIGFAILTARPSGFRYKTHFDEETKQDREGPGLTSLFGATAGMRLTRGVGIGGLVMYGRGGGTGTVTQIELNGSGGTLTHEGPADFTQQSLRIGPHARFMAGGDVARFLVGTSLGAVYAWLDLEHVDVVESGGSVVERGTYHHDYSGIHPYWGFDLGAEFNIPSHFLLGFAFDVLIERTRNVSRNPFGGTAQGYIGFSARVGVHDWKSE
jgi:hypothetical protein